MGAAPGGPGPCAGAVRSLLLPAGRARSDFWSCGHDTRLGGVLRGVLFADRRPRRHGSWAWLLVVLVVRCPAQSAALDRAAASPSGALAPGGGDRPWRSPGP